MATGMVLGPSFETPRKRAAPQDDGEIKHAVYRNISVALLAVSSAFPFRML
jgi:hypothetical protein